MHDKYIDNIDYGLMGGSSLSCFNGSRCGDRGEETGYYLHCEFAPFAWLNGKKSHSNERLGLGRKNINYYEEEGWIRGALQFRVSFDSINSIRTPLSRAWRHMNCLCLLTRPLTDSLIFYGQRTWKQTYNIWYQVLGMVRLLRLLFMFYTCSWYYKFEDLILY